MRLCFLRHGIADDRGLGMSDAERRLTGEGIAEMRAVGAGMKRLGLTFDLILTSPLPRAHETAVIAAESVGAAKLVRIERMLVDGGGLSGLRSVLTADVEATSVLLVGHEPDMSGLAGMLIGGGNLRMKKASLACLDVLDCSPGGATLLWLLTARQLSLIGQL